MKQILCAAFLAAILSISCTEQQPARSNTSPGPLFSEVLTSRRSIRSYDASKTINREEVRTLLTAVQEAPSWANQQPTHYYVAITPEKIEAVRELIGPNKSNTEDVPVLIVSTFERGKSGFFRGEAANEVGDGWGAYDNGLSNAYLVLQARAMGFDTLIMGIRDADGLRALFGIPETESVMAVIALGYRSGEPNRPERKNLNDIVSFY